MDSNAKRLVEIGDGLFTTFQPWNSLRQEICELCYPMRADYTASLSPGSDFQTDIMDSSMTLARETLGNLPHAMLRQGDWYSITTGDKDRDENPTNAAYFEATKKTMRKFMYAPRANFVKASIEADHDWVSVGNPVLSVEENVARDGLLYRAWHPKTVVWMMDGDGQIDHVQRDMPMTARNICRRWKTAHQTIKTACEKEPNKVFKVRHILMPSDDLYGSDKTKRKKYANKPFISLYVDCENNEILGESGLRTFNYVIPRLRTLSNIPVGFSPYAINSLPDGRMLQDLARIMLEQGEKAIDPPAIAKANLFREFNVMAGGLTYADLEDKEKLQDVFQYMENRGQLSFGLDMRQDVRMIIAEAWLLNKLTLPQVHEMTAFETNARLDEYRRAALPFFGPIESEYHLPLLELTFNILMNNGAFDAPPEELDGGEIDWQFEGPLNTLEGRQTVQAYNESIQIIAAGAQFDQTIPQDFNLKKATEDAVRGTGAEPEWFLNDDEKNALAQQQAQAAQLSAAAGIIQAGGTAAESAGKGIQALQQASVIPGGAPQQAA